MRGTGTVEALHTAPDATAPMEKHNEVTATAGKGLHGDRYYKGIGTFSDQPGTGRDLTLTEAEAIAAVNRTTDLSLTFADHRRNITTRDVALNHLVGDQFRIGDVVCKGVRLCEPCHHLHSLVGDGVVDALTHRGGLRATILEGGTIRTNDRITPL